MVPLSFRYQLWLVLASVQPLLHFFAFSVAAQKFVSFKLFHSFVVWQLQLQPLKWIKRTPHASFSFYLPSKARWGTPSASTWPSPPTGPSSWPAKTTGSTSTDTSKSPTSASNLSGLRHLLTISYKSWTNDLSYSKKKKKRMIRDLAVLRCTSLNHWDCF